jgi:hypothetical protein
MIFHGHWVAVQLVKKVTAYAAYKRLSPYSQKTTAAEQN